jgi:hypothetical protein
MMANNQTTQAPSATFAHREDDVCIKLSQINRLIATLPDVIIMS